MKKQIKITEIICKETTGITLAKYLISIGVYNEPKQIKNA
jgi:hypothetical protein